MSAATDPVSVGRHDEEHLRRFLRARAARDAVEMRRWWDELVVDFYDRVDGFVAAAHRGRLDADEHELAVQRSMIRFSENLFETFEGISMGQLVNATLQLAKYICMDVQKEAAKAREKAGASFDAGWDDPAAGDAPRWHGDAARRAFEDEEVAHDVTAFFGWALPQVADTHRAVLRMTIDGAAVDEICTALAITPANVYQRRKRGIDELRQLKEQYDA